MARYIDIEGAGIGKANRENFLVPEFADGWNAVLKILEKEPTADVEEVVRCIDCKHSSHFKCCSIDKYKCKRIVTNPLFAGDFFCKFGERKEK